MKNNEIVSIKDNVLTLPQCSKTILLNNKSDVFVHNDKILINGVLIYDCENPVEINANLLKLVAYCEKRFPEK